MCSSLFFVLFSSFSLLFSGSVKTQILVKCFYLTDSLHNIFALTTKKVFSEIRTIRIFHHFTDKSTLNVQIRPHYYTVFPAFPQQILSRKRFFELLSSNFLSSFPNIRQIQEPQKSGFPSERSHHFPVLPAWHSGKPHTEARAASDSIPRTPGFSKLGVLCWEYEMSCRTLVRQPRFSIFYTRFFISLNAVRSIFSRRSFLIFAKSSRTSFFSFTRHSPAT